MSHLKNQEFLEYWYEYALELGYSDEEAIEYADKKRKEGY